MCLLLQLLIYSLFFSSVLPLVISQTWPSFYYFLFLLSLIYGFSFLCRSGSKTDEPSGASNSASADKIFPPFLVLVTHHTLHACTLAMTLTICFLMSTTIQTSGHAHSNRSLPCIILVWVPRL